jgi:hypothetical protein
MSPVLLTLSAFAQTLGSRWLCSAAMTFTTLVLDALLLAVAYAHALLAPYNKVEESFNLHAVHDVLAYGVGKDAISQVGVFSHCDQKHGLTDHHG